MTDDVRPLRIVEPAPEAAGLDRLAEVAARMPIKSSAGDPEAVLREALVVGRARARAARTRRISALAIGALALAATAVMALRVGPAPNPAAPSPTAASPIAVALPEGHRVHALAGSSLSLGEAGAMRLDDGAALFDVSPLAAGRSFVVTTPDATVTVVGTVFAVTVSEGATRVDVFEGRVDVSDAHGTRRLERGGTMSTGAALVLDTALDARGRAAAELRDAHPIAAPSAPAADEEPTRVSPADAHEEIAAPRPTATVSSPAAPPSADLAAVRAMCDRGEFAEALAAIERATPPPRERGDWAMVEGDAERALGRLDEAAAAYERAATTLTPTRAALAGFLAASVHQRRGDPDAALASLDHAHAADRGSPVEERALATRASLLARLGRGAEARTTARAYLAAFPGGDGAAQMDAILASP